MSDADEKQKDDDAPSIVPGKPPETIKVVNVIDEATLRKDLTYSLTNLSDAMMTQAGLLVDYNTRAAKAAKQVDDLKLLLETTEATVYRVIRDKMIEDGKKITEAQLDRLVATHPRVIRIKKALNEAKQIEAVAKGAVEGFRHRKDMLVQLGASERQEKEGELRMSARDPMGEAARLAILNRLKTVKPEGE